MPDPVPKFATILKTLIAHQVQFIVVGGICGRLHGAPLVTDDIDIVHSRSAENLARLLPALLEMHAYYRGQGDRRLTPRIPFLEAAGPNLLMTDAGPLDVLGTIGVDEGYDQLLCHTIPVELSDGVTIRMLDLPTLIRVKEIANRSKDLIALPILRATLAEQEKGKP